MRSDFAGDGPTFWLNVTTSRKWARGPVGIVRVEQEILKQLGEKLQHRLKTVVYHDGGFLPESSGQNDRVDKADFWPEPSFGRATDPFDPVQRPSFSPSKAIVPVTRQPKFRHGDVLITLGLDWEYPGLHEQIGILKKRHGLVVITCCYDLIPILFPQYCVGDVASWFKSYLIGMTWLSDGVLCISENTRRDYEEFALSVGAPPRLTEVIKLGSSLPPPDESVEPSIPVSDVLDSKYFLFVSTLERRKNHEVLYRAYHLIRKNEPDLELPKLVFVGMPGWGVEGLMSDIQLDPLVKDDIIVLPHVSDNELSLLYASCEAFLFPSLYEGWGLPVAEALQFGRPVIASDSGSIPEIGGGLVRYVDPWSPQDWAIELLKIIKGEVSTAEWSSEIAREFEPYDWASAASTIIEMAHKLRAEVPSTTLLEPGYDLSSLNGTHYGDKIIYDAAEGVACHGPYIGLPSGRHRVQIDWTWISGATGYVMFIASHAQGSIRVAVERVKVPDLVAGKQMLELTFELSSDITDFEISCQVRTDSRCKFSIDRISIIKGVGEPGVLSGQSSAEPVTLA